MKITFIANLVIGQVLAVFLLNACGKTAPAETPVSGTQESSTTLGKFEVTSLGSYCSDVSYVGTVSNVRSRALSIAKSTTGGKFTEGSQCDRTDCVGFCKQSGYSESGSDGKNLTVFYVTGYPKAKYTEEKAKADCGAKNTFTTTYP